MFKLIFFVVLFFILMFLLLGVSFLRGLKTLIFGGSNRERQNQQRRQYSQQQQSNRKQQDNPVSRKKIFTKDVGEYVDYEEVKEDKTDSAT